jgi:hypothetical protein
LSDIHHISEVDIRNALYSPIGPLVGVKTNWDYRQLMGLKGPAFVNVFASFQVKDVSLVYCHLNYHYSTFYELLVVCFLG